MESIPQPPTWPIIKNMKSIDPKRPTQSIGRLARELGPIYKLEFPDRTIFVVSSQELVNELCDETRFDKHVSRPLENLRPLTGQGLFTAHTQEEDWGKAHRILVPAFGPHSMRNMFEGMLDIIDQLILKWQRFGEHASFDLTDNMTRLTLDTIALCAFGYRFNSFYQEGMHPFVDAMARALSEAGAKSRRLAMHHRLLFSAQRQFSHDVGLMHAVADQLIVERRAHPLMGEKDLVSLMLEGRDPKTGEGLSDKNIQDQMVTFLIAGHETTSGLLSFACYEMLRNPEIYQRAQAEADLVFDSGRPRFEDLSKLGYIDSILKETLRLWPTAPVFTVKAYEDTIVGGRYFFTKDQAAFIYLPGLHRDPKVWGEDANQFRPERFDSDLIAALPANAWKPFGNGQRGCIGRPFAMQEATLALAMIVKKFDLQFADPTYQLKIKETLTHKPDQLFIRARSRIPSRPTEMKGTRGEGDQQRRILPAETTLMPGPSQFLVVAFGSNSGTARAFAEIISAEAKNLGYDVKLTTLDSLVNRWPELRLLVVITASYDGNAPDNAKLFVEFLPRLPSGILCKLKYAVFGCGNRLWTRTFQAIPKLTDQGLEAAGGTRFIPRGEGDARGDIFADFERWKLQLLDALLLQTRMTEDAIAVLP